MRLTKKDKELLSEAYNEVIEENNLKSKIAAVGVGLGLAGLGQLGANRIVDQDKAEREAINTTGTTLQTNQDFRDINNIKSLIQNYFKLQGKDVKVQVNGDNILIGNKSITLKQLKQAVDGARESGSTNNLPGYLAQNL